MSRRTMRSNRKSKDDLAVSEVIGVVMLLAMVITMMGGVFIFLTPYVNDFQDNTAWSNANGIAERLDGRIDVVAGASNDTGLRTTISTTTSSISPLLNAEEWTLAADLSPDDEITVTFLNKTSFGIFSQNETANKVTIWTQENEQTIEFDTSNEEVIVNHMLNLVDLYIVTVFADDEPLHRSAKVSISGLQINTKIQTGQHSIALLNDARYDKYSDETWEVTSPPNLNIEELFDGTMRASLSLRNVETIGAIPDGRDSRFDIRSAGPVSLFSGDAWNFRFTYESSLGPTITPQMTEGWLTDYNLNRASDTLDQHRGLSPWQRASGFDGLTVDKDGSVIDLEIELQLVEVSR